MKKEIINILISNRSIKYGDIFNAEIGLNLKDKYKTFPELVIALDNILYIIDYLEANGYIEIKKTVNTDNKGDNFFVGIPVETENEKAEITINKLHWFVKHIKDIYCWDIVTKSGLIGYIKNGYKTDNEISWVKTRNLSLSIAIITAVLTSILTALLTSKNSNIFCYFFEKI